MEALETLRVQQDIEMSTEAHIAVVIPCYRVEEYIADVIAQVPDFVRTIVVVDDHSPDDVGVLIELLSDTNLRAVVVHHEHPPGRGLRGCRGNNPGRIYEGAGTWVMDRDCMLSELCGHSCTPRHRSFHRG